MFVGFNDDFQVRHSLSKSSITKVCTEGTSVGCIHAGTESDPANSHIL